MKSFRARFDVYYGRLSRRLWLSRFASSYIILLIFEPLHIPIYSFQFTVSSAAEVGHRPSVEIDNNADTDVSDDDVCMLAHLCLFLVYWAIRPRPYDHMQCIVGLLRPFR